MEHERFGYDPSEEIDSCTECLTDSDGPQVPVLSFDIGGGRSRLCRSCSVALRDALTEWIGEPGTRVDQIELAMLDLVILPLPARGDDEK